MLLLWIITTVVPKVWLCTHNINIFWTNYFSPDLHHFPQQPTDPTPTQTPHGHRHYNQFNTIFLSPLAAHVDFSRTKLATRGYWQLEGTGKSISIRNMHMTQKTAILCHWNGTTPFGPGLAKQIAALRTIIRPLILIKVLRRYFAPLLKHCP